MSFFEIPIFDKFNKLMHSYRNREEKKYEIIDGQRQYGMPIGIKISIESFGLGVK